MKKFLSLLLIICCFIVCGCEIVIDNGKVDDKESETNNGNTQETDSENQTDNGNNPEVVTEKRVSLLTQTIPSKATIGKVDLSGIRIRYEYENGNYELIHFSLDMLSEEEKAKLNQVGEHTIHFTYEGCDLSFNITILEDTTTKKKTVNFFTINDLHGQLITDNDAGTIGLDKVSTILDTLTKEDEYIKVVCGDMFQGSFFSNSLYGRPGIEWLNYENFDCFVLGNHEFDWGIDKIAAYKDGDLTNGELNEDIEILGCNIYLKSTNAMPGWLDAYSIEECNGYKVGVIGCIGEGLTSSIAASMCKDYVFVDPVPLVKEYAKTLRTKEQCDVVVVAIHDYNTGTDNQDFASLSGDSRIDAIISGHTHTQNNDYLTRSDNYQIPVIQCYGNNGSVGTIQIKMENNKPSSHGLIKHYSPKDYQSKKEAYDLLFSFYEEVQKVGERVIGYTATNLSRADLGEMICNILRAKGQADIGIYNTGGVRSAIAAGNITYNDIYKVFPFENTMFILKMKGKSIKYGLNSSLYYNSDIDLDSLNDNQIYTVAIVSYVYENYESFNKYAIEATDSYETTRDLFEEYVQNNMKK